MDVDVSIVIVSYQSRGDLGRCLSSLRECGLARQVLVIDNASQDGSRDLVDTCFPEVRLICLPGNFGFAKACNVGVDASSGKYCLFVNPDAHLSRSTVQELIRIAEENPRVGLVGPRVFDEDGRTVQLSCRSFPTIGSLFFHRFSILNLLFPGNRWRHRYLLLDRDLSEPTQVDWVSGCCILARRDMLKDLGGFDERFFMYSEDVDLCLRARQAGWATYYVPSACITHRIGGSSDSLKPIIERHRSVWRYYKKHLAKGHHVLNVLICSAIAVRCCALSLMRVLTTACRRWLRFG